MSLRPWSHKLDTRERHLVVSILLESGSDVHVRSQPLGDTPLHKAAQLSDSGYVELLLEYGASVSVTNECNETPLHLAVTNCRNLALTMPAERLVLNELMRYVKHADDLNIRGGEDGSTVLHMAIQNTLPPYQIRMLLSSGADFTIRNDNRESALDMALKSDEKGIRELGEDFQRSNASRELPSPLAHDYSSNMIAMFNTNGEERPHGGHGVFEQFYGRLKTQDSPCYAPCYMT